MADLDPTRRTVEIDSLYLDLEVCTPCRGTDANLETALAAVKGVLEAAGVDVRVTKTPVDSEEKARPAPCCDPKQQESCCAPSQKRECCGPEKETSARACDCQ